MKATSFCLIGLLTASLVGPASADVLEMPEPAMPEPEAIPETESPENGTAESGTFTVTLPGKGMTKDQVEDRFGSAPEKVEAVGEPPISSWVYKGFTVYFEYDHVIHAVNHK